MDTAERVKKVVQEIEDELLDKFGPMSIVNSVDDYNFDGAKEYSLKQAAKYEDESCIMTNLENALRYKYWLTMSKKFRNLKVIIMALPNLQNTKFTQTYS